MKASLLLLPLLCFAAVAEEKPRALDAERKELEKLGGFQAALPDPSEFNLHFELLIIAVPAEDALLLAEQFRDPATSDLAFAGLLRHASEGKAKVLSLASLITKPGQRAVSESNDEVRYPIEFDPPRLNETGRAFVEMPNGEPRPDAPPAVAPVADPSQTEKLAAIPTTFETRNVGEVLELEATLDPATLQMQIQIAAQRVVFKGMEKHTITVGDTISVVEQPRFATNKVNSLFTLRSGERVLLGTFRVPEMDGWVELHILRAAAQLLK